MMQHAQSVLWASGAFRSRGNTSPRLAIGQYHKVHVISISFPIWRLLVWDDDIGDFLYVEQSVFLIFVFELMYSSSELASCARSRSVHGQVAVRKMT
jgi:hypothetical protein